MQEHTPRCLPHHSSTARGAHTFSITKLASSGIVLLHLQSPTSIQAVQQDICSTKTQAEETQSDIPTVMVATESQPGNKGDLAVAEKYDLPSSLPIQVVLQILDDLQAGTLLAPE